MRHGATSCGGSGSNGCGDLKRKQGWEGEQGPEVKEVIVKRPEVIKSDRPLAQCALQP